MIEVIMPKLSINMEQGTVLAWFKSEGDQVQEGEPLLQVETDKAAADVESPASGSLGKILFPKGETVPVATVIAYLLAAGEEPPVRWPSPAGVSTRAAPGGPASVASSAPVSAEAWRPEAVPGERRVHATPRAKRLIEAKRIDITKVKATGPGGRITEEDVLAFLEQAGTSEGKIVELSRIQQISAQRLTASFTSVPHFYLSVEASAGELSEVRKQLIPVVQEQTGVRLTFTDLLIAMVAHLLKEHPLANASWRDGSVLVAGQVSIGIATAVDVGLIVPVIHQADEKSLAEIAAQRAALIKRAAEGKLRPEDLEGGTFTITNLGMFGVDALAPIINPPQSAILGVGRIAERPTARDGKVIACPTVHLSLSLDHRVLDGVQGARFLSGLSALIEEPSGLPAVASLLSQ